MPLSAYLQKLLAGSEVSAVTIVNDNATCDAAVLRPSFEHPIEQQYQYQQQHHRYGGFTKMNRAQSLFSMVSSSSSGSPIFGGGRACPNDHLTSRWENNISRAMHSDSTLGKPKRRGSTDTAGIGGLWNACMLAETSFPHSHSAPASSSSGRRTAAAAADTSLAPPARRSRRRSENSSSTKSRLIPPMRASSDSQNNKNPSDTSTASPASTPRSRRRKSSQTESPRKPEQSQPRERRSSGSSCSSLLASLGPMAPTRKNSGTQQMLPSVKQMPALQNVPQRPTKRLSRTLTPHDFHNIESSDEFTCRSDGSTLEDDVDGDDDGVVISQYPNRSSTPPLTSATANLKFITGGQLSPSAVTQGFPKSLRELPYEDRATVLSLS